MEEERFGVVESAEEGFGDADGGRGDGKWAACESGPRTENWAPTLDLGARDLTGFGVRGNEMAGCGGAVEAAGGAGDVEVRVGGSLGAARGFLTRPATGACGAKVRLGTPLVVVATWGGEDSGVPPLRLDGV